MSTDQQQRIILGSLKTSLFIVAIETVKNRKKTVCKKEEGGVEEQSGGWGNPLHVVVNFKFQQSKSCTFLILAFLASWYFCLCVCLCEY